MPVFSPELAVAGAGLGLLGSAYGYYNADQNQTIAQQRLNALNRIPLERYGVNPAIQRYYQTATNQVANPVGYSPQERGAFLQELNQGQNAQYANATSMTGGNLSKALNFLGASGRIGGLNQFAMNDAQLRRQYLNNALSRQLQGANYFQNADNMNTQTSLSRRLMTEQALGGAIQSNRDYKSNLFSNMGQDILGGAIGSFGLGNDTGYSSYRRSMATGIPSSRWLNI